MRLSTVTLRRRPISKGRQTLFLDYYPAIRHSETMKMIRWEYLGIYIYEKPRTEIEKDYNAEMLNKAEAIRSIRVQAIINEEYGFIDKHKRTADFLEYFRKHAYKHGGKWLMVYTHFHNFTHGKCTFGDLTVDFCRKFSAYLLKANQLKLTEKKISQNCASAYFSTFRAMLKVAYRDKMIRENLNDFLESIEITDVKKEYLTLDEVKLLAATPCRHDVLKRAALFSCLTGLRISDIQKLRWEEIGPAPEGGYCMRIRTEKTDTESTLPISDEALELCLAGVPGQKDGQSMAGKALAKVSVGDLTGGSTSVSAGDNMINTNSFQIPTEGLVFHDFQRCMIQYPLRDWIKASGIRKHITFHTARHVISSYRLKTSKLQA